MRGYPFSLLLSLIFMQACQHSDAPDLTAFRIMLAQQADTVFDLWIRNGTVIDGTGSPARAADILVRGEEIAYVGLVDTSAFSARQVIDARDKVVAPGFIDAHAHGAPLANADFHNFLAMGVTTICLGQDGSSPAYEEPGDWMARVDSVGPGVNIALFAGHGTLRRLSGIGYAANPPPDALSRMEELLDRALAAGCYGLSTGLEYTPGAYAEEEELLALARVVGDHDGLIMSHVRNEDDDAIEASLRELLLQGRHCNVHVAHLKVVYGKGAKRAETILALLDSARQAIPHRVTADVYPYTASYTGIGIVFPDWAKPPNDYQRVVRDRREALLKHLRRRITDRNGPEATLFGTPPYAGQTLADVANQQELPFEEVLLRIGPGGASGAYFIMDEPLQARLLSDPHVMISSDGSPSMHHPRGYGSFAKIIETYVRERKQLPLEEAVYKMSGLPANTIGLTERGVLTAGKKADIVVFAPQLVRAEADFSDPHRLARGFERVLVNGAIAWHRGIPQTRRGKMLRRPRAKTEQ